MTLACTLIQIIDMKFSENVTETEFYQWLAKIQNQLELQQDFILIMETMPRTQFPESYRLIQSQWYKQHKTDFYRHCLGLVRIAQDQKDLDRLDIPALHKAWRVPYFVSLSKQNALDWALQRWSCHN